MRPHGVLHNYCGCHFRKYRQWVAGVRARYRPIPWLHVHNAHLRITLQRYRHTVASFVVANLIYQCASRPDMPECILHKLFIRYFLNILIILRLHYPEAFHFYFLLRTRRVSGVVG